MAIEKNITPDFLILWSAPLGKPRDVLTYQIENGIKNYDKLIVGETTEDKIRTLDYIFDLIDKHPDKNAYELWKIAKKDSKNYGINKKSYAHYLMPYKLEEARMDNTETLKRIDISTLVIIGNEDILVDPVQSKKKLDDLGNKNMTFKKLELLNHSMTKKGTDQRTNMIYNVDLSFKQYLLKWLNELEQ